jgi:hypothetical protein
MGFVQSLRVIVANVEERHAIGKSITPENLIHRQLADDVRIGTTFTNQRGAAVIP